MQPLFVTAAEREEYERERRRYVVKELGNGKADVIHMGPYAVSKGLKVVEAIALAKALNDEARKYGK